MKSDQTVYQHAGFPSAANLDLCLQKFTTLYSTFAGDHPAAHFNIIFPGSAPGAAHMTQALTGVAMTDTS
jgi:hypothetical protein